ncbi:hypothetical protein QFA96_12260 [Pseudomonas sp. Ap32]|nr:hypothetical protein QFA96_12260 [Pseudomonas sp. Ap32]
MPNDIDLYDAGDIQPYDPGQSVLAPLSPSPDTWGRTDVDVLTPREIAYQGQTGPTLFGAALPPGTTSQQINVILGELGGLYMADLAKLGYPSHLVQAAIAFFTANATKAPTKVQRQHSFDLRDSAGDWLAESFGNHLQGLSGTIKQRQQFLDASLQWLALANKKLGATQAQQNGNTPAQGRAPSSDPTAQLTDAQYERLVKHNEQVKAQTINRLAAKYGDHGYQQVIALAQTQLERLPAADRKHFDCWTGDFPWTHMLSTFTAIEGLYRQSIGAIPNDGASIAQELAAFDSMLRVPSERAKYQRDPQMQARYRELIRMRDGG